MQNLGMFPLIVLFLLSFCIRSLGQQASPSRAHIAVLNLEGRGISEDEAATLSDRLRGHLVNTAAFVVLDRGKMESILKEQGFQQTGCTITECAVRAGRILNVQKMVAGSIGKIGKKYTLHIEMIDMETSRIERSLDKDHDGSIEGLLEPLQAMAEALASTGKKPSVDTKRMHKLTIYSYPKGAKVILNNKVIGETPLSGTVPDGSRLSLRLKYPGYQDWEKALTMTGDEDLNVELVPQAKSSSRTWLWIAGGVVSPRYVRRRTF
jgi:hypothetical protein